VGLGEHHKYAPEQCAYRPDDIHHRHFPRPSEDVAPEGKRAEAAERKHGNGQFMELRGKQHSVILYIPDRETVKASNKDSDPLGNCVTARCYSVFP
jgi:hypothetical protein